MRQIILFVILSIGFNSFGESTKRALTLEYGIDSVTLNPDLEKGKSLVVVNISNKKIKAKGKILYGYDLEEFETFLNSEKSFAFELDSGAHVFQFYPADEVGYGEITTHGGIHLASGTTTYISLTFIEAIEVELHVRKPVIYLYPTAETDVTVFVQPKGEMSFTYPEYTNKWECTALPSGELIVEDKTYNYLFWEAEQSLDASELTQTKGKIVLKENLTIFLEKSLDKFGFTSKETMDFITFWAPQMQKYEATDIRFMINEDCALFADLTIDPKPDNLLRFYIIWSPSKRSFMDESVQIEIPSSNRSGFTVLEWGGMEIPSSNMTLSTLNHNSLKN